jgi:hypothetical protein
MLTHHTVRGDKAWEANGPDQLASHALSPLTVRTGRGTSPRRTYYATAQPEQSELPWAP